MLIHGTSISNDEEAKINHQEITFVNLNIIEHDVNDE